MMNSTFDTMTFDELKEFHRRFLAEALERGQGKQPPNDAVSLTLVVPVCIGVHRSIGPLTPERMLAGFPEDQWLDEAAHVSAEYFADEDEWLPEFWDESRRAPAIALDPVSVEGLRESDPNIHAGLFWSGEVTVVARIWDLDPPVRIDPSPLFFGNGTARIKAMKGET